MLTISNFSVPQQRLSYVINVRTVDMFTGEALCVRHFRLSKTFKRAPEDPIPDAPDRSIQGTADGSEATLHKL